MMRPPLPATPSAPEARSMHGRHLVAIAALVLGVAAGAVLIQTIRNGRKAARLAAERRAKAELDERHRREAQAALAKAREAFARALDEHVRPTAEDAAAFRAAAESAAALDPMVAAGAMS